MDNYMEKYQLPLLSKVQRFILDKKTGRYDGLSAHLKRGGKLSNYLPLMLGDGYGEFWKTKARYRIVKGSRASKKTVTTARQFIYNMMKFPESNLLVVRKVGTTNKDSTFAELKKAIYDLGVSDKWNTTVSPLEITYKKTGQKIVFRGLDDPQKISGVTVSVGHLCWVWIEEAYEMKTEDEFDFIDESIRGILPDHLWYQITMTLNPWNKHHWIKKRFFDPIYGEEGQVKNPKMEQGDVFAMTTNYFSNEFIDKSFKRSMERMKENNPRRYRVAGLGEWGMSSGLIFENWIEGTFDEKQLMLQKGTQSIFGLDWGYTNDPTAFIYLIVDRLNMKIYAIDEFYKKGLSNRKIAELIKYMGYQKEVIVGDSSEPKSIDDLYDHGIWRIEAARKGRDSVLNGIQRIQDFQIIADYSKTPNFCMELDNYIWDEKNKSKPADEFNHICDAMRYAFESYNDFGYAAGKVLT